MDNVTQLPRRPPPKPPTIERITRENFYERGQAFIRKMEGQVFEVLPRSPEFEAWEAYFTAHLNWKPHCLGLAKQGKSMTMPTQWPEWFDTDYARAE